MGAPRFKDWHTASGLCGPRLPPATVTSARVLAWVTCEVVTPGTGVPYPAARAPVSNDLYVVYLPQGTTISDDVTIPRFTVLGHTFGPYVLYSLKSCFDYGAYHFVSFGATSLFAYAVVVTHCARDLGNATAAASHEMVEAATDPIPPAGWIDDGYSIAPPTFDRLLRGEAADMCEGAPPVVKSGFSFAPYWSNRTGNCVTG